MSLLTKIWKNNWNLILMVQKISQDKSSMHNSNLHNSTPKHKLNKSMPINYPD